MDFNAVDVLLALVVLFGAFSGYSRGFLLASLDLAALLTSLAAAFVGYRYPAGWLASQFPALGVWIQPIAFVGTFVVVHLVLSLVERAIANTVPRKIHVHGGNRFLGLAPGAVNGLINATVVAVVLLTMPFLGVVSNWARDSKLAGHLSGPAEWVEAQLAPIFDPAVRRTLQALMVQPESRTSIPLKFTVQDPRPRPDLESRMLQLVNEERARHGLEPLAPDPEIAATARAHSREMFARGYFSHVSPDGKDLGDRLRRDKVRYLSAGENLALAPTLASAHRGLMNSPGHRANILRPQFGRLGIGVLDGGPHGLMVTQNFRN